MTKAVWNETTLAESNDCKVVEGNYYFPPESVHTRFLRASDTRSICPWKGTASYYDVCVNGKLNKDAAWYYPEPKTAATNIAGHIAFWNGVQIQP